MNNPGYGAIPSAYAQTNAGALATSGAPGVTVNSSSTGSNTTEGLQIKRGVNYFDSASGYLVYPSTANNPAVTTGGQKTSSSVL